MYKKVGGGAAEEKITHCPDIKDVTVNQSKFQSEAVFKEATITNPGNGLSCYYGALTSGKKLSVYHVTLPNEYLSGKCYFETPDTYTCQGKSPEDCVVYCASDDSKSKSKAR